MVGVLFTEAAFNGDADDDIQKGLVVLGFVAEDFEASLAEKEEGVCGADFLGFGVYAFDFGVDEFRHDDLAVCDKGYLLSE